MKGSAISRISMAVTTRVWEPDRSRASCSARALMTVASMPMWSPTTRSKPAAEATTPRIKFPPPITMATSTPSLPISWTSSAMRAVTLGSTPKPWFPRRASPLSFSSTRLKTGSAISRREQDRGYGVQPAVTCDSSMRGRLGHTFAHFESREAPDSDVLAKPGDLRCYQVTHRAAAGLVLDEVLVVETIVLKELVHLAFHDPFDHLLGLPAVSSLASQNFSLALENLRCHVLSPNESGIRSANLHGNVVRQFLKLLRTSYKIALAVHFHHNRDLRAGVDVGTNQALAGRATLLLHSRSLTALAKEDNRLVEVSSHLLQRLLAIHHRRATHFAQLLDVL